MPLWRNIKRNVTFDFSLDRPY